MRPERADNLVGDIQDKARSLLDNLLGQGASKLKNGLMLSGGGARSAYQVGIILYIADKFPHLKFPLLTGVSAGAINAADLAQTSGGFVKGAHHLEGCWRDISQDRVFESPSSLSLIRDYFRSRSVDPLATIEYTRGIVVTDPLREFLDEKLEATDGVISGIDRNIRSGELEAVAIVTTNYSTAQTVTWVQGKDIEGWQRPTRVGVQAQLTTQHVMASTALPLLFPAVKIGDAWFGDGGIRFSAPLAPLVHLGANRILAISTRYNRSRSEADEPDIVGYPTTSRIFGLLLNAIFLDALDQDALTMKRINELLKQLPHRKRLGLRPVELLVLRPSRDLGKLAGEYEAKISGALGLITRAIGPGSSKSPDWLSMLLFDQQYISRLIEIGYDDAKDQHDAIEKFYDEDSFSNRD